MLWNNWLFIFQALEGFEILYLPCPLYSDSTLHQIHIFLLYDFPSIRYFDSCEKIKEIANNKVNTTNAFFIL